jgi:polysaccharide chain length determinant protein (PEP-CTERM system associated)
VVILPILALLVSVTIPPQYVSQTLVLIEQQKVPDEYVKPVVSSDLDQRLASMKEQILSRSRIEPIIQRFNLFPGASPDDRLDQVRKNIDIKPIHSEISGAGALPGFFISYRASDPHTAQQVCGEITSLFVNENLRAREQTAQGTTSFIESQLASAKSNLDQQDAKLAEFQRKFMGRLPGEENTNLNMLNSVNSQLEATTQALSQLQQQKAYQESMLTQMTHEASLAVPTTIKGVPDERQTQLDALQVQANELSTRYTADYPDLVAVRRKIADLRREMAHPSTTGGGSTASRVADSAGVQQLRAQIQATNQGITAKQAEQMQLQSAINAYQGRLQASPQVEEQYKALTRDYQTAQKFYDELLAKMNQSQMATDLEHRQQGEQFRVMDEPNLPNSPEYPKRSRFLLAGLAAGLLIGLGVSAFLEYRNTAIQNEDDVFAFTKLPTLAVIARTGVSSEPDEATTPAWKFWINQNSSLPAKRS